MEHTPSTKTDAAAAFLASLEGPKLTSLADAAKKPPIEILPPGMASLYGPNPGQGKPTPALQGSKQQTGKQLLLEGPNSATQNAPAQAESVAPPTTEAGTPPNSEAVAPDASKSSSPPEVESSAPAADSSAVSSKTEPSVPPETNTPANAESNEKTDDKQSPVSSIAGGEGTTTTEEQHAPSPPMTSPSSVETAPQPPNNQGSVVNTEPLMIDF